jgi:hypothetical protein
MKERAGCDASCVPRVLLSGHASITIEPSNGAQPTKRRSFMGVLLVAPPKLPAC